SAFVRSFIRRFDVNADQVERSERFDSKAPLGDVIGIEVAGGAGHVNAMPADEDADAAHEIDGGDDGAARAVCLAERADSRGLALPPEPHLRRRFLALGNAASVHRM